MPTSPAVLATYPLCSFPECGRHAKYKTAQLCAAHYKQMRYSGKMKPRRAPNGSTWLTKTGYVMMTAAKHPNSRGGSGQILVHRYVMSEHLGRPLLAGETVHHKDGDRQNNAIENLELWADAHSYGARVEDQVAAASATLRRYAPHLLVNSASDMSIPRKEPHHG